MMSQIDRIYQEAEKALANAVARDMVTKARKKKVYSDKSKENTEKIMKQVLWLGFVLFAVLMVIGLGAYAFAKRDVAFNYIKDRTGSILGSGSSTNPVQGAIVAPVSPASCDSIAFTDGTKTADGKPTISLAGIGKCYLIPDANKAFWVKTFSDGQQVTKYAAAILKKPNDGSLSSVEVVSAIQNSLSTGVLDLRKAQPVVPTNTPLPVNTPTLAPPTSTPVPAATATPVATATLVATATPAVIPVVAPYKEVPLLDSDLAKVMATNNIPLVTGDTKGRDIKSDTIFAWLVYYDLGNGTKDYLVLDTFRSKNLPTQCTSTKTTSISISLNITNAAGELAVKAGDKQIWVTCK